MYFVRFEGGIVEVNALQTDFNVIKKELDEFPSSTDLCTDKDFGIETVCVLGENLEDSYVKPTTLVHLQPRARTISHHFSPHFQMPRTRMPEAIQRQSAVDTASPALDAASRCTPHSVLNTGRSSTGKSIPRGDNLKHRASFERQASPSPVNNGDRSSRRASCGDLGPAPREAPCPTTRRASLAHVHVTLTHHPSSGEQPGQHASPKPKRTESAPQAIKRLEVQKSSGSRYFAEIVRRRKMQITVDFAAAKTDVTHPSSWSPSSAESRASPRDIQPRSTSRRSSISSSSPVPPFHPSSEAPHASLEHHGTPASPHNNPGRQQKSSGGSRYCAELVRRREKQKNAASAATTEIKAPIMVTESTVIASILVIFCFGLMSCIWSVM